MEKNENTRDGRNQSLWQKNTSPARPDSSFNPSKVYDVLVVGAGITGMTTALLLQKAGLHCVVADAHNPGYGTTGGTTAHINTFADTTFAEVESDFSEDAAKQFAGSIAKSVELIHSFTDTYQIDCDFEWKKGFVYAQTEDEVKELDDILNSSMRAGVQVAVTDQVPVNAEFRKAIVELFYL